MSSRKQSLSVSTRAKQAPSSLPAYLFLSFSILASQNVMAPNLTRIAGDLDLSPTDRDRILGGWMSSAFFLVGAPLSLVVGYLADIANRKHVFIGVAILSIATNLGLATVTDIYWMLALRALSGATIAACSPLLFSLLGDLYAANKRSKVSSLIALTLGAGGLVGQLFSGFIVTSFGWRAPYVCIAVLGVCATISSVVLAVEPARGAADMESGGAVLSPTSGTPSSQYDGKMTGSALRRIFCIPSTLLIFVQAFPGNLPWAIILVFLPDYLATDAGFTVKQATIITSAFAVGAAIGGATGGVLGQRVYNYRAKYLPLLLGTAQIVAVPPTLYLLATSVKQEELYSIGSPLVLAIAFVSGILTNIAGPNLKAILLNVNTPETRGTVLCVMYLFDSISKGLGPLVIASLVGEYDRVTVFSGAVLGWLASGAIGLILSQFVEADLAAAQARIVAATSAKKSQ